MTEANSRSWNREGANEDLRREDFWFEDVAGAAETFEVVVVACFLLMATNAGQRQARGRRGTQRYCPFTLW